jgi:hypothetical protein
MTQAEGYADGSGISAHMVSIWFRPTVEMTPDLTVAEREQTFYSANFNIVTDCAKQNTTHALQGINAALHQFKIQFPHIKKISLWSDGANDYTGVVFMHGLLMSSRLAALGLTVISHNHSIPGEGKDRCDMLNGQLSQGLGRLKAAGGVGSEQRTATDLASAMDLVGISGVQNFVADIDRVSASDVSVVTPAGISVFYGKRRVNDNTILANNYTGVGDGTVVHLPASQAVREKLRGLEAGVQVPPSLAPDGSTSEGEYKRKPTRLLQLQQKEKKDAALAAKRAARRAEVAATPRLQMRAKVQEALVAGRAAAGDSCPYCRSHYTTGRKDAFDAHVAKCARIVVAPSVQQRISDEVGAAGATA